jgi:hypothetical protein
MKSGQTHAPAAYKACRPSLQGSAGMFLLESLVLAAALAAAVCVRPWRLLAGESGRQLLAPLLVLFLVLPALWWWPGTPLRPLSWMVGTSLALLTLGWPLTVLLLCATGAFGLMWGHAPSQVAVAVAWCGVLPATLALGAGALVRRVSAGQPFGYILGRGFLIPFAVSWSGAMAAQFFGGSFDGLRDALVPALAVGAMFEAMVTGVVVTILVAHHPAALATWSEAWYLGLRARTRAP